MPNRHKIVFQTNAPYLKSGLAENGRILMNWLAKRGKYDLTYYCSQTFTNDPNLSRLPYKAYGAVPADQNFLNQFGNDFGRLRDAYYGGALIGNIIKQEKPSIWVGSDDIWAFPNHYFESEWFKQINSVLHITVDSVPISDLAYKQAKATKYFLSWAGFAAKEMRSRDPKCGHVDFIYGASDTAKFKPISADEKKELRMALGLNPRDTIFIYLGRNQLRKQFPQVLQAFALFKKENPKIRAKLLFHTAWNDSANGWDIPRLRDYLGVLKEDVLATTICRSCGKWEVKPYIGEEKNCPFCKTEKSVVSVNGWNEGVSNDELHLIYGLADASISAFSSGGLEFHSVNSLLCGLPMACTNYSCGEDFCEQPFVYPISWNVYFEHQSSFIKSSSDPTSIKNFMAKIVNSDKSELQAISEAGRDWAAKTFSIDTIGPKWEKLFDSMPYPDWSSISLIPKPKNDKFPMPQTQNPEEWVTSLYQNILLVEPDPEGFKHWLDKLKRGINRESIYNFFISQAKKDNLAQQPPQDFWALLDKTTGKKRALIVMKESIGDCVILTSLFESFHKQYPNHDLYIATDPKHFEVFACNPHVFKTIPCVPGIEQELSMTGAGRNDEPYFHVFIMPAIASQKVLGYLSPDSISQEIDL